MTVQEMIAKVPELTLAERRQLMDVILDSIIDDKPVQKHSILELEGLGAELSDEKSHNILEFAGVAAELYDGTDAQEYINQLRSEWDDRP